MAPASGSQQQAAAAAEVATTAVFYSVSSSQAGLTGVDLGNFLIKRVAKLLIAECPGLTTLATLSPIPNLRAWTEAQLLRRQARHCATGRLGKPLAHHGSVHVAAKCRVEAQVVRVDISCD